MSSRAKRMNSKSTRAQSEPRRPQSPDRRPSTAKVTSRGRSALLPTADLAEMTRMWAVEKYIDHWDGYSGHAVPGFRPNNYYLYSDPSGRFQMLPWGADQAWIPTIGSERKGAKSPSTVRAECSSTSASMTKPAFAPTGKRCGGARRDRAAGPRRLGGRARRHCSPRGRKRKKKTAGPNTTPLKSKATNTASTQPSPSSPAVPRKQSRGSMQMNRPPKNRKLRRKPVSRPAVSSSGPISQGVAGPDLVPGRFAVVDGVLVSRIWVSGAGALEQRASISTRRGRIRVCATDEQTQQAGPVVLRCKLSATARRRLSGRALQLRANTTFVPLGRAGTATVRNLTAPRDASLEG